MLNRLLTFLLLLTTMSAFAQKNYEKEWKEINDLFTKKGLTESAQKKVQAVFDDAKKTGNDPQMIKAIMYQLLLSNARDNDAAMKAVQNLEKEMNTAKGASKHLLQSMLAEKYWQYYQQHRWQILQRTNTVNFDKADFQTWSVKDFNQRISALYLASVSDKNLLQAASLDAYDPILLLFGFRFLRPTMYDFLAHRALQYFENDEKDVAKPAYAFQLDQAEALANAAVFSKHPFETKDVDNLHHKAVLLYQDLLKFRTGAKANDALLDVDIDRLSFMYRHSVHEDKENLYESALKQLVAQYPKDSAIAQAHYLLAAHYNTKGERYDAFTNKDNQYDKKRALEICEMVVKNFPRTEGAINAERLRISILGKEMLFTVEKVNVPNQPFRMLLQYKNIAQMHFRIIKTTPEEYKKLMRQRNDAEDLSWQKMVALKPLKSWSENLPDLKDYQSHAAEAKLDGLPTGYYILLASEKADFATGSNTMSREPFWVSNISYVTHATDECFLLHRDNGNPLANAKVQIWYSRYDYNKGEYKDEKGELKTSDANGFVLLPKVKSDRRESYKLEIKHSDDYLFLDDSKYVNYYDGEQNPKSYTRTFLFTDRAIYRPGQTVFFKGIKIMTDGDGKTHSILTNNKSEIVLRDATYQEAAKQELTTNDFGSYKGSFKIPEGLMNGYFRIYDKTTNSEIGFRVEEYKRPKFFVEVKKPGGTYRLRDSVQVTGQAKAYAGNVVDGAKVKYRVQRKVRYPIWWWGYDYGYGGRGKRGSSRGNNSSSMEIANGETTTNAKGEFTINFKAIPDLTVKKSDQPTFDYEVSVDVTDLNGETRSGNTSVAVAYQSLQLNIVLAERLNSDSLKNVLVRSSNTNDVFEAAKVNLTIHALQQPQRMFRSRLWDEPDQFLMSKEAYYNLFPYDVWSNENETKNWAKGSKLLDSNFTTVEGKAYALPKLNLPTGWYLVEATTKDKGGEMVTAKKYVQVKGKEKAIENFAGASATITNPRVEPIGSVQYNLSSTFNDQFVVHFLLRMHNQKEKNYYRITGDKTFAHPVGENDRGGMSFQYLLVRNNRLYEGTERLEVPWSNKELDLAFETFRDKTEPGSVEKWKLKIKGHKGDIIAAEMMAGMYDASLDQFAAHSWYAPSLYPYLNSYERFSGEGNFKIEQSDDNSFYKDITLQYYYKNYDRLNWGIVAQETVYKVGKKSDPLWWLNGLDYGYGDWNGGYLSFNLNSRAAHATMVQSAPSPGWAEGSFKKEDAKGALQEVVVNANGAGKKRAKSKMADDKDGEADAHNQGGDAPDAPPAVQPRKNFNETAFFFPDLSTDAEGNIILNFTMPEALTEWKFLGLAHTKDLAFGQLTGKLVTQKQLMVQPFAPRFMREGDKINLTTKISNLTDKELSGKAQLLLIDATTNQPVDGWFKNIYPVQYFTAAAGQSTAVSFSVEIPYNYNRPLTYRIVAQSGAYSDGEEANLPVLTNRMLVTESQPIYLRGNGSKNIKFEKLLKSDASGSLSHHAVTVEYASNPIWYAVQALPYLMEYPYECAEQTWNRFYANALASYITGAAPRLKAIFEKWKTTDTAALLSNLMKNEELKSVLLQETPWVMAAQNETQQKKNIALLFDLLRMNKELSSSMEKLKQLQASNGGFVWFKGGQDDRYITQYIVTGIGHLTKLGAMPKQQEQNINQLLSTAIPYLDRALGKDYADLIRSKASLKNNHLGSTQIQYLYMRSFFNQQKNSIDKTAFAYYEGQAKKLWLSRNKMEQAMIALALHRNGDNKTPNGILASLKENALSSDEMGMYYKDNGGGYYWYQAPVETQAMVIEAFADIKKDNKIVDDLKTWLLKQKQTTNWKTTVATAEACYAVLLQGTQWLTNEPSVSIQLGAQTIQPQNVEAGTGYIKQRIDGEKVKPELGNININVTQNGNAQTSSWGAVYWQYFEDIDKITTAATPLVLKRKLFIERNSDKGPVLDPVVDGMQLKVGDKIKVRIELTSDRNLEYVHMKDLRAANMEPVNVISTYKWQGGLGYYESTKDACTNFFISYLQRGTYVFEYPLFITHSGNYSAGLTTIQCMYAPEFGAHSEGIRILVND
jgi:uncharacterized protein YfaS (alpha-2-macroglobulin family)